MGVEERVTNSCLWGTHVGEEETEVMIQILVNTPFHFKRDLSSFIVAHANLKAKYK